jgi:hypothetical protein
MYSEWEHNFTQYFFSFKPLKGPSDLSGQEYGYGKLISADKF